MQAIACSRPCRGLPWLAAPTKGLAEVDCPYPHCMERMKKVKRPPLYLYPHDGSLQRNSSNQISQLLRRGREENRRGWQKL
ncbi:hypothetical protein GW17_00049556 [Ensete ventricosum]|nr:hypothetical protein GW17_00049556 [Ensete ventricosum]